MAGRQPIVVDGMIEGFVKGVQTLTFYWINRAGHMVIHNFYITHFVY